MDNTSLWNRSRSMLDPVAKKGKKKKKRGLARPSRQVAEVPAAASSSKPQWQGIATAVAPWAGASTSKLWGFLGMVIVTFSFARTTRSATKKEVGYAKDFYTAVRGGGVMDYLLCSLGVSILFILLTVVRLGVDEMEPLMGRVADYGLGGCPVAMVVRVGGGIYTKAADVGADWVGMVVAGLGCWGCNSVGTCRQDCRF